MVYVCHRVGVLFPLFEYCLHIESELEIGIHPDQVDPDDITETDLVAGSD